MATTMSEFGTIMLVVYRIANEEKKEAFENYLRENYHPQFIFEGVVIISSKDHFASLVVKFKPFFEPSDILIVTSFESSDILHYDQLTPYMLLGLPKNLN